ncbi:N,N-dimethylformamidase beta subunit family domain-containing protein [Burkholderia gladioli]|uniref:N,N-dimethylformamidase beta subunit family domain-containing protein n=1 Tax=Burkholderia gladioli TaxID=28095 RepID=UPI00164189BD|nr:N,N-dimethylformamidase beta subunit family domain-containing protein [Burkholderia gladioli]
MSAIIAYSDRWSVAPGETIRFMVSCANAEPYDVQIVRLRQPNAGPGASSFEPECVAAPCNGRYEGHTQTIPIGSLAVFDRLAMDVSEGFSLTACIRPTTPRKGRQAIMGAWSEHQMTGSGLELDERGALQLVLGRPGLAPVYVSTGVPMTPRWHRVAASFDAAAGTVTLWQEPLSRHDFHNEAPVSVTVNVPFCPAAFAGPFTMAAWSADRTDEPSAWEGWQFACHFNGCIARPRVARGPLARDEITLLDAWPERADLGERVVAAWDFTEGISGDAVTDLALRQHHGILINQPTRAVPGHDWEGEVFAWPVAPDRYGAIHFHDDDLVDACWASDFEWVVPNALRSGVYAAHLTSDVSEFWIPFVVRPPRGKSNKSTARILLLLPTATYIAYQNHRTRFSSLASERLHGCLSLLDAVDVAFLDTPEMGLSTYDRHSDGSGVAYASRHRPAQNVRPDGRLWNFNVDLFIVDWLEKLGVAYDVVTDEDLHAEQAALLTPYATVITGSHPEYASREMLDAIECYLQAGGRLMYMGGNGFYWRTAFHPERSGVIEVRRADGVRAWDAEPGALHMSFNGERGGLWRQAGRAPQRLVGVGFVAQGFDRCSYYRRTCASYDPCLAWMFEGICGEVFGDYGMLKGGAAGIEIDACSDELGTPPQAIVIARSENHSNTYEQAGEEVLVPHGATDALLNASVRAEMVFFAIPGGGAVFSTGSIAYAGALGCSGRDHDVFRLTTNVLCRFVDPAPFDFDKRQGRPLKQS